MRSPCGRCCKLRLEASGPLALFAQNFIALCVYEILGLLRFALGLCVKPQVRIDLAQLIMGRRELRIQFDNMFEHLSGMRPILFRPIELA
jgi:hypothetical protein